MNKIININQTHSSFRIFCIGKLPPLIEDWHKTLIENLHEKLKKKENEITDDCDNSFFN